MVCRIGPRMSDVLSLVRLNPGKPMLWYAEMVGPHGSRQYGYRTVHRVIKSGLVIACSGPRNSTLLFPCPGEHDMPKEEDL